MAIAKNHLVPTALDVPLSSLPVFPDIDATTNPWPSSWKPEVTTITRMVTTNKPFDEWTGVFGSERLTGALLDRLSHHVQILEMKEEIRGTRCHRP